MSKDTVTPTDDGTKLEVCSSKQREFRDRYEPSLTWLIYPSGLKVGYLNFTRKKRRYRKSIASTNEASVREIRDQARKMKTECINDPEGFMQTYFDSLSLACLVNGKFLSAMRVTRRSYKTIEYRVKPILAALGEKPVNRITRYDIESFLAEKNKTKSVATVNRYLAQIKAIMSFAVERGIIKSSPVAGIPAKHEAILPPKGLPDEVVNKVVHRLMKDIDDEKARLLLFLFATGCRLGEARALQLQDCNINQQIAYLPTSKSGRERLIPLNHFALELIQLQFQRHGTTGLLFRGQDGASPISEPRRYWYRVCNDCGLSGIRIHDARHTVATSLLNQGCSLDVLQKVLGHSSQKMTERYARFHDTTLVNAVNKLSSLWDLPRIS